MGTIVGHAGCSIDRMRQQRGASDALAIAAATLPREARALETVDFGNARRISAPALLLLGGTSPPWAETITRQLQLLIPHATVVDLVGQGHEAIDTAPDLLLSELFAFFDRST